MKITDDMLTEWFPNHVKPTRIGLYEVRRKDIRSMFMMWNGTYWTYQDGAYTDFGKPYRCESTSKWRGLKDEPSLAFEYAHRLVAQRLNKEPQRD
ncbi:hypothetical protein [Burkholderia arboris]|uniref:hypothetical protein n=1 Tax=Burkholderia arboris TaxID=488730 RepID=UPI001CF3AE26|nr:hypothetical protein [Burkholderia arboris]MCA8045530.1 hypothetical protein [Burkholderia arboris]